MKFIQIRTTSDTGDLNAPRLINLEYAQMIEYTPAKTEGGRSIPSVLEFTMADGTHVYVRDGDEADRVWKMLNSNSDEFNIYAPSSW